MDVDEEADQKAIENDQDTDPSKNDKSAEGMRDDPSAESKDDKSFGVKGKEDEQVEDKESGSRTRADQQKSLADESLGKGERLELVEGISHEEGKSQAGLFQHVIDEKEEDKAAIDKADMDKDINEQILPDNWDVSKDMIEEKKDPREIVNRRARKKNLAINRVRLEMRRKKWMLTTPKRWRQLSLPQRRYPVVPTASSMRMQLLLWRWTWMETMRIWRCPWKRFNWRMETRLLFTSTTWLTNSVSSSDLFWSQQKLPNCKGIYGRGKGSI